MPRYIDVDVLWRDITSNIEDCGDVLEIIERQPVVTINDTSEENKVTKCNHIAEGSKKVVNGKDTVYRQDVIDQVVTAVRKIILDPAPVDFKMSTEYAYLNIYNVIYGVPSAQPEIIRCKDCKNWDTTWTNDFSPNYHYCPMVDGVRKEDWYCADAERRTDE